MIYRGTVFPFMSFAIGLLAIGVCLWLFDFRAASRRVFFGAAGSCVGYLVAPCVAVAVDVIPSVLIEPRYFREPFIGCISPVAGFMASLTSLLGTLLGCAIGCTFALRWKPEL